MINKEVSKNPEMIADLFTYIRFLEECIKFSREPYEKYKEIIDLGLFSSLDRETLKNGYKLTWLSKIHSQIYFQTIIKYFIVFLASKFQLSVNILNTSIRLNCSLEIACMDWNLLNLFAHLYLWLCLSLHVYYKWCGGYRHFAFSWLSVQFPILSYEEWLC